MNTKAMENNKSIITGSREAVKGYDYQFLWTIRRCISMLHPNSNLKQLIVEGLHPEDELSVGDGPETFLGIDIAEYYGGYVLKDADKVVISQLKYSYHYPKSKWTISRLCKGKKGNTKSSIIGRLGFLFKNIVRNSNIESDEIRRKISLQLISNRPIDSKVETLLSKSKYYISSMDKNLDKIYFRDLEKVGLTPNEIYWLDRMYEASNLRSNEFILFLLCFDVPQSNLESSVVQQINLTKETTSYFIDSSTEIRKLYELIVESAKSEAYPINKETLLTLLETTEENFNPAPCLIDKPDLLIKTNDSKKLSEYLRKPLNKKVIVHGIAGIGKSVTLLNLEELLPAGSKVVLYDCYAKGEGRTPNKRRYPDEVAITQIVNEIGVIFETETFLFRNKVDEYVIWEKLQRSINKASKSMPNNNALLVIAIDAADNAIQAMNEDEPIRRRSCFIPHIWNVQLPDNLRLILTCRTHRRSWLTPNEEVKHFALEGFSSEESRQYIISVLKQELDVFTTSKYHEATNGVPRLQYYWIQELKSYKIIDDVISDIFNRTSYGLSDIYSDWVESASSILSDDIDRTIAISVLRTQQLPISVSVFAKTINANEEEVINFFHGLEPGVVINANKKFIYFRDEDFEAYLDDKLDELDKKEAHLLLSNYCIKHLDSEEYAILNVTDHLYKSAQYKKLIEVVLLKRGLDRIDNAISRYEVASKRLSLSFDAAYEISDYRNLLILLFEYASIKRGKGTSEKILLENPELAIEYDNYDALINILNNERDNSKIGKMHFRISAALSNINHKNKYIRQHLEKGKEWLRMHIIEARNNNWNNFEYTFDDSINVCITLINENKVDEVKNVINKWRPKGIQYVVTYQLFIRLSKERTRTELYNIYNKMVFEDLMKASALAGMYEAGVVYRNDNHISKLLNKVRISIKPSSRIYSHSYVWLIPFIELCIKNKVGARRLNDIIKKYKPQIKDILPGIYSNKDWFNKWDKLTRFIGLCSVINNDELNIEKLYRYSPSLKILHEKNNNEHRSDIYDESKIIEQILPMMNLHSYALYYKYEKKKVEKQIYSIYIKYKRASDARWYKGSKSYDIFVLLAIRILSSYKGDIESLIRKLIFDAKDIIKGDIIKFYLECCEYLYTYTKTQTLVVEIIEELIKSLEDQHKRAYEYLNVMMKCSFYLRRIDPVKSRRLFNVALEKSNDIDYDAPYYLRAISEVAYNSSVNINGGNKLAATRLFNELQKCHNIIDNEEYIPWNYVIRGVSSLHPSTGFSAVINLHKKGWKDIKDLVVGMMDGLLNGDYYDMNVLFHLGEIARIDDNYVTTSLDLLNRLLSLDQYKTKEYYLEIAQRVIHEIDTLENYDYCDRLIEWGKKNGMPSGCIDIVRNNKEYCLKIKAISMDVYDSYGYSYIEDKYPKNRINNLKKMNKSKLIDKIDDIVANEEIEYSEKSKLLSWLKNRINGEQRLKLLDKLLNIRVNTLSNQIVLINGFIIEMLKEWGNNQTVINKYEELFPSYIKHNLKSMLVYTEIFQETYEVINKNKNLKESNIPSILISGIIYNLKELPVQQVYECIIPISNYLNEQDNYDVLNEVLNQIYQIDNIDSGQTRYEDVDINNSLVLFLYDCLEQPDNRTRWQAIHCIRKILYYDINLFKDFVELTHLERGRFWMSAREWLMFLILHMVKNVPINYYLFINTIYMHIENEEFPHAGIKQQAKIILKEILEKDATVLDENAIKKVEGTNIPKYQLSISESDKMRRSVSKHKGRKWSFEFDIMDTLPYWYSPLARCFGLHRCDVGVKAERWITEKWKISNEDCYQYYSENVRNRGWELYSNRQGTHPTIETLQTYAERHAMFMAAGEMIRELPVVEDEWIDWINHEIFNADPYITSEIRTFPPTDIINVVDDNYGKVIEVSDFIIDNYNNNNWVIVGSNYRLYSKTHSKYVDIESVLIPVPLVISFAMMVANTDDHYTLPFPEISISYDQNIDQYEDIFAINNEPDINDVHEGRFEYDNFKMIPIIVRYHSEKSMHAFDPKWPQLSRSILTISKHIVDQLGLSRDAKSFNYMADKNNIIVKSEAWLDEYETEEYPAFSGERVMIRKDMLLKILRDRKLNLVFRVFKRKYSRKIESKMEERDVEAQVLILDEKGRITEMGKSGEGR